MSSHATASRALLDGIGHKDRDTVGKRTFYVKTPCNILYSVQYYYIVTMFESVDALVFRFVFQFVFWCVVPYDAS